ncbi:MAG TPA: ferrochelatase [Burkholderiaceae bacterium]|nr:ferrochelatase [Burkholderiaceae bacterium]
MRYQPEPAHEHGTAQRTGVLLLNLGTPEAPQAGAVRRYLAEFLSDPRVVEIPRALWMLILHGVILRVRPARSAAKYAQVWTPEGSPLKVWTDKQARLLQGFLGERGLSLVVKYAMRYGTPSVASQLTALKQAGCLRILVLPLYPQYSATTTASAFDAVHAWARTTRLLPEFRFVNHYHDAPSYIEAMARRVLDHWQREGRAEHLLMSFHGVPERMLNLGDPYHCECHKTARLLAQRLGLAQDHYSLSFQSRLGRAKWLQPYTDATLKALGQRGIKHLQVICPGFVADCLETLEEIAMEGRDSFIAAGGKTFEYIPALNDHPAWINALATLVQQHVQGWPAGAADPAELAAQRQRATKMGAPS